MTLPCVPPWIEPTVITTGSIGLFSRETTVCSASTMREARTTGSTVLCGIAACPPRPKTVIVTASDIDRKAAGMIADRPRRHRVVVVQRQRDVRPREAGEQAVVQDRQRPAAPLFGRLGEQHQRPVPRVPVFGHHPRGPAPGRHVDVVAARVHDVRGLPAGVGYDRLARERQPCLLLDRERVELGAQHHGRTVAVLQDGHDARAADARRHVVSQRGGPRRQQPGRARLLERQLGMAVQVDVQGFDVRVDRVDVGFAGAGPRGAAGLRHGRGGAERRQEGERDEEPTHRPHPRRLKNWTARSCRSAAARVLKVPRLRRRPVFGSFFRE